MAVRVEVLLNLFWTQMCIITFKDESRCDVGVATRAEHQEVSGSTVGEHVVAGCLLRWLLQPRLCVATVNFPLFSGISANSRWR